MLREVVVSPPIRTAHRYEFPYTVHDDPRGSWRRRLKGLLKRTWPTFPGVERNSLGFVAKNFTVQHCELWDSIFPLWALTRNGGPLFGLGCESADIVFKYPILESVSEFYIQRARHFGIDIRIHARTYDRRFDLPTHEGCAVLFSGGKESRLMYGVLKESGVNPDLVTGVSEHHGPAPDLQGRIVAPLATPLMSAAMAAIMSPKRLSYVGVSFVDTLLVDPWGAVFDWTPGPQIEFSDLLRSLGVQKTIAAPLVVLPCNLVQKILAARYPHLCAHQRSVPDGVPTEKNLHVSLLRLHNGLDCESHCPESVFRLLLRGFVERQLHYPEAHGFHSVRKIINLEMRSIIFRLRNDPRFAEVRPLIPTSWDADWIEHVHPYVHPAVPREFLDVFAEYARVADPKETRALVGTRDFGSSTPSASAVRLT